MNLRQPIDFLHVSTKDPATGIMKNRIFPLSILMLASFVVLADFAWQGDKGFDLWDEGFLWYGVQHVMLGEIPMRDFMSYDPGRYYWSAALMTLWGDDGLMGLRVAAAVFQAIGLFVGLLLIASTEKKQNYPYLLLSAITLAVCMWIYYKQYDYSLSILLIGALAFLVQAPTSRRYFCTGVFIGLVAVFGRNHGVYGVAASVGVMLWLSIKRADGPGLFKGLTLWATGVVVGFMPIILMVLLVPGFAISFWESILFLFEIKTTNLSLPIPWPWRVDFGSLMLAHAIRGVLIGLFFIAILLFGALSVIWVVSRKLKNKPVPPALVAASFLALPYAHYAYSRAEHAHLSLGIFPFLVGCLVFLATLPAKAKWPLASVLCAASVWMFHIYHPGWQCHVRDICVDVVISENEFSIYPRTAREVGLLREAAHQYASNGETFIATPLWPGAYALLERKAPMWETFPLFPRSAAFQEAEIDRMKAARPAFAIVVDLALDRRDERRFQNKRPLIHQYILDHFDHVEDHIAPMNPHQDIVYQVYKAKQEEE